MPVVTVNVPQGARSAEQTSALVTKITDVVVEVEGKPALRPYNYELIDDLAPGGNGVGGRVIGPTRAASAEGSP